MDLIITRYNLAGFKKILPLLLRCFPDFWTPRLAEGKYSFPYDLKLFTASLEGTPIGCIGVHEYPFLFEGEPFPCGGVCDVAVDPDFQGRGYSVQLQEFFMAYCRRNYKKSSLMPLYTGKPGVYLKRGWQIYESDRSTQIPTELFPAEKSFRFDAAKLSLSFLRGGKAPRNEEENTARRIMELYSAGKKFNGKCLRSGKTWWELFADPKHHWRLEENTYFLYRENTLLEAYSSDPAHQVNLYTPLHGGFEEDNKVMVNLPRTRSAADMKISEALKKGSFVFPAADIF